MVIDIAEARANVEKIGFLNVEVEPTIDVFAELERLKKEKQRMRISLYLPGYTLWRKRQKYSIQVKKCCFQT